jgi:hypothetical protein
MAAEPLATVVAVLKEAVSANTVGGVMVAVLCRQLLQQLLQLL